MENITQNSGQVKRLETRMTAVQEFKKKFAPFLQRYLVRQAASADWLDLTGHTQYNLWYTVEHPLTDTMIGQGIMGKQLIGYFLSVSANCLCLDIDDHTGKGLGYLLSVYNRVCAALQTYPSILCTTPHGLHAFYFLDQYIPEVLLIARAQEALSGVPIEVKPTSQVGLRVPAEPDLIDPRSFEPLNVSFTEAVTAAAVYHPVLLFGIDIMPKAVLEGLQESLNDRQRKVRRAEAWESLGRVEAEYMAYGIQSGGTNQALCELIPIYRSYGLNPDEAAARFTLLLSKDYAGELWRNPRRLLQRIRSFYKNVPETRFTGVPKEAGGDLFTELLAEAIARLVTGPERTVQQRGALTKKRRTVKNAVQVIERWRIYVASVIRNKQYLEMWNYLYPYFKKNTGEGYYPLSRNILKKLHEHYERWLIPFLKEIGYLERAPYRYSKVLGICYYYRIDGFKFLNTEFKPQPKPARIRKSQVQAARIRKYKEEHPNATVRDIAERFRCSTGSVSKYLNS